MLLSEAVNGAASSPSNNDLDAGAHQVRPREVEPVDVGGAIVVLDCEGDLRSTSHPERCLRDPKREATSASKEVNQLQGTWCAPIVRALLGH